MANRFQIPTEIEARLRRTFKACAYFGRNMKVHSSVAGCRCGKATIEHLNRLGPFYWSQGLKEKHLVIACQQCNASRGTLKLREWFKSAYCIDKKINVRTVASRVKECRRTATARR